MNRKRVAIPILLLALAGAASWYYSTRVRGGSAGLTASGTVEATDAALGFAAAGRILEVVAHEGDRVRAGAVLARLDTVHASARLQQARAQLKAAEAVLLELEHGTRSEELEQARAEQESNARALAEAETDLARNKSLAEGKVISQQALDRAQLAYDLAKSRHDQSTAQLKLLEAGPRPERIAAQRAQAAGAEAEVRSLEAAMNDLVIVAPFDAIITTRHHEPGEAVGAGVPILSVINPGDRWVRIYIPEPRIGAVHLGERARIKSDTYPGKRYSGTVSWLSDEAEFTPRNVQTTEERVKLVYAAKVRIQGDSALELKPGMPADVELEGTPSDGAPPSR